MSEEISKKPDHAVKPSPQKDAMAWLKTLKFDPISETDGEPSVTAKIDHEQAEQHITYMQEKHVPITLSQDNKNITFIGEPAIFYLIRKLCFDKSAGTLGEKVPFDGAEEYKQRFKLGLDLVAAASNVDDTTEARFANVSSLIDKGAYINARDKYKMTALHGAVISNDISTARILLEHGANPNATTVEGDTPLHYAVARADCEGVFNYEPMVELLIQYGANPIKYVDNKSSALKEAVDRTKNNANISGIKDIMQRRVNERNVVISR